MSVDEITKAKNVEFFGEETISVNFKAFNMLLNAAMSGTPHQIMEFHCFGKETNPISRLIIDRALHNHEKNKKEGE